MGLLYLALLLSTLWRDVALVSGVVKARSGQRGKSVVLDSKDRKIKTVEERGRSNQAQTNKQTKSIKEGRR
jgi:hypothetical protein